MLRGATLLLLLLATVSVPAPAAKGDRLPYRVGVRVRADDGSSPESFRDELARSVERALAGVHCFAAVSHGPAGADLLLDVDVLEFVEETTYHQGVATLHSPDLPPDERNRHTVQLRTTLRLALLTVPESAAVRSRQVAASETYRPVLGEDPRFAARSRVLEEAARITTGFACKGSAKKLARAIEQARASLPDR